MQKKHLLLFTDFYPDGGWGPFLDPEMKFLFQNFQRVFIFSATGKRHPPLPAHAEVVPVQASLPFIEKMLSLRLLFAPLFLNEMQSVRKQYKLKINAGILKTALVTLQQAIHYKRAVEKFLEKRDTDDAQLFCYSYWADSRAVAVALLKRERMLTGITRAHGWDVYFNRHAIPYLPYRAFLAQQLDALFFVSENGMNYFSQKTGIRSDKLRLSRLAIDAPSARAAEGEGTFHVISCAHLLPLKRAHLVADILSHVTNASIHWTHFGSGAMEKAFKAAVEKKLARSNNVVFRLMGAVPHEALMHFYKTQPADLFIHTSEYEGMPLAIIEALAFGVPVMATHVGGVGEVINSRNGFLLEKDFDPAEAAAQLSAYISLSKAARAPVRQAAWETWRSCFDAGKNFPAFINEFSSLLALR